MNGFDKLPNAASVAKPDGRNRWTDLLRRAPSTRPVLAEALSQDFGSFVRAAWRTIHPGRRLHWNWMMDFWCERMMQVKSRQVFRGITNCPPRTAKTTVFSICYPCWVWTADPSHRFLCASYEMALAKDHNIARRALILSEWYQQLFGDRFKLSGDRNLAEQFGNDREGAMVAASVEARSQGRGGDTVILDDPQSDDMALSDLQRKSSNDWITHTLFQRLNDPATSAIYLVQQRLHQSDTTGFVMELEPDAWTLDQFPLIAEEDEHRVFPISGRVVERKKGQCLDPKRFPPKVVATKKLDRYTFASQFQQQPCPLEGNLVRRSDVRYVCGIDPLTGTRDEGLPDRYERKIISVDTSFKDIATADYVAIAVVGVKGRKRYLLNMVNTHLDSTATEDEILRQREIYKPVSAVLVEDKSNGAAVIKRLKRTIPGVIAINPEGGKVSRVQAMAPEWQAGDWYVLRNAAWTEPFLTQLLMFPTAKHDDMVDAVSQASVYLQTRSGWEGGWLSEALDEFRSVKQQNPTMTPEQLALTLADAQKNQQGQTGDVKFARDRGAFGAEKVGVIPNNRIVEPKSSTPTVCPNCGNVGLARREGFAGCVCGWSTTVATAAASRAPMPQSNHWLDCVLGRSGL